MATTSLLTPEILVPKLGDYLVDKGLLSPQDLIRALKFQDEQRDQGNNILVGQILIDLHLLDREILDQAITEQILNLRAALQETNKQLETRVQSRTKELQNALKRLSELNKLKSNIISNISHEFRTPLTHIKGYIELLSLESLGPLTPDQAKALNVMRKSSEQLEELIDRMIRFSLISKGEFTLNLISLDVLSLLKGILSRTQSKAQEKKISLVLNVAQQKVPPIIGDMEKISWVLLQLVDNAIKFTPELGQVILGAELEGESVLLSVSDTGIGIPANRIQELFEPFHQLDGSSTRRYGGTGLGLALAKQIIEAHGSILRVHSQPNIRTRFDFSLQIDHSDS